jgi:hypothetical protein
MAATATASVGDENSALNSDGFDAAAITGGHSAVGAVESERHRRRQNVSDIYDDYDDDTYYDEYYNDYHDYDDYYDDAYDNVSINDENGNDSNDYDDDYYYDEYDDDDDQWVGSEEKGEEYYDEEGVLAGDWDDGDTWQSGLSAAEPVVDHNSADGGRVEAESGEAGGYNCELTASLGWMVPDICVLSLTLFFSIR